MIRRVAPRAAPRTDDPPPSVTDAGDFLYRLEDLRGNPQYDFAADTLEGIYTTVERTGRVTEGQLRAVDNIEAGGQRGNRWERARR